MKGTLNKIVLVVLFFSISLVFHSCILDEFKVSEVKMKEEWEMEIISPLFYGNFEFVDLIFSEVPDTPQDNEHTVFLETPEQSFVEIPSKIIFERDLVISNYYFLISGNYNFTSVSLEYTVSNGSPFPLNFQMQFNERDTNVKGPPVLPSPPFDAAIYDGDAFEPVVSKKKIKLNEEQLQSFKVSRRIDITTWFNSNDLINQMDTFLSDYPIEISIHLYGELGQNNED